VFDTLVESGLTKVGKKKWFVAPISIIIHGVIITIIVLIPILFPQVVTEKINVRLFAPPPPPPPPPPPAAAAAPKPVAPKVDVPKAIQAPTAQIVPITPKDIGKGEEGGGGFGVIGGVIGGSTGGGGSEFLKEVAPSVGAEAVLPPPVMVTANMTPPKLIQQVQPEYPLLAKKAGVEGTVLLRLIIGADGRVQEAKVLTVIPPNAKGVGFEDEAIKAVMQWKFTPALTAGKPTRVYYNVPVKFVLR